MQRQGSLGKSGDDKEFKYPQPSDGVVSSSATRKACCEPLR